MKFKEILHYVKDSFRDKPSFVILMDDDKKYISNGCVFTERTEDNIQALINKYDCKSDLYELFKAPSIEIEDLTNAKWMFAKSNITEFHCDLSGLEDGRGMFARSELKSFKSHMPSLKCDDFMFYDCTKLIHKEIMR